MSTEGPSSPDSREAKAPPVEANTGTLSLDPSSSAKQSKGSGQSMVWLSSAALACNLLMVAGILLLLFVNGVLAFWPRAVTLFELADGSQLAGEIYERETFVPEPSGPDASSPSTEGADASETQPDEPEPPQDRWRIRQGNRELTGADFVWISESDVSRQSIPEDVAVLERLEWGNFFGWPSRIVHGEEVITEGRAATWDKLQEIIEEKHLLHKEIEDLEDGRVTDFNYELDDLRLELRKLERKGASSEAIEPVKARIEKRSSELETVTQELFALRERADAELLTVETADGDSVEMPVSHIVRATRPNSLSVGGSIGVWLDRLGEFLWANPRESNTEGGVFPALFGTVLMVFLMTICVVPLGVLAALYLREYAREGFLVRAVRIAVNNLAGVPSIVFGIFGLGFFVYMVGGSIDSLFFSDALPAPTFGTGGILWASLTLALLTLPVVIVATEEGLSAVPRAIREGSLALGATKWETTKNVVLPAAAPGILTGTILAMARAAGEVAPLMIVGMVKLAPTLPVDHHAPWVHLDRKFMHLGFHIFDLAFQSPNVEAAKPLVFATALLLVVLVLCMNLTAIATRNHLRRKYTTSAV